jgi:hypothetical protein
VAGGRWTGAEARRPISDRRLAIFADAVDLARGGLRGDEVV